jgi:PAS domain S-box-containing protein
VRSNPSARILHVDDEEAGRYVVARMLRQAGYEVISASSGLEALRMMSEDPDLVLLDVNLPDMSGFEVCQALKSDPKTAQVPVLHLSASYLGAQDQVHGLEGGADGYLTQPVEPTVLIATIGSLLRARWLERETREWKERYEAATLASGQILFECALSDLSLTFGGCYEQILGYTEAEMPRNVDEFLALVHPEDLPKLNEELQQASESVLNLSSRYRLRGKSGRWVYVVHNGRPVAKGSDGWPASFVGFLADVTEQQEAQTALDRQALTIENMHDSVALLDERGRVLEWNPAGEAVFGYTRDEMLGRSLLLLQERSAARRLRRQIATAIQTRGRWSGVTTVRRRDGARTVVDAVFVPIHDKAGGTTSVIAVSRDITERAELEEQLRQAQKLEAVGKLAGGVAHDFNNLLTVICGYSDLLLERLEQNNPLRKSVDEIHRAAGRAAGLVRQLLAFSRRQVLQPKGLSLQTVVDNVAPMLQRLVGRDVELEIRLDSDLGQVRANPVQVEQVVVNLGLNARDAMAGGGRLAIEASNVDLEEGPLLTQLGLPAGGYVRMTLTDTGCGMDLETQRHIFEPFFSTKGRAKSTGLGLSTVYGVVKQSGGAIEVKSEPDQGTSFSIYLPRLPDEGDKAFPGQPRSWGAGSARSVLVVEDEEVVRTLVRDLLEANNYVVLEAHDGSSAIQLAARHTGPIDLVVTDVVMPDMNGREMVERLVSVRPDLRVLYMSGYTEVSMVHHGVLEAGSVFLQKPFTPDELALKVGEALESGDAGPDRIPFMERLASEDVSG